MKKRSTQCVGSSSIFWIAWCLLLAVHLMPSYLMAAPENTLFEGNQAAREISGKITDDMGEGLPGASVLVKGTSIGTITDVEGNFKLSIPEDVENPTLIVSFIGYLSEEIAVGNQTAVNITLVPDIMALDEVVVVGYGTQRRGEVTSAIASVKQEDFIKGSVRDAAQLVKGKVAGLTVNDPYGNPTGEAEILLRGTNSLSAFITPLVIIDGIPGGLKTVAPEDIASIDVVKDGSAAAIYGVRANGGVIFITTKKGNKNESVSVEYSGNISTQQMTRVPKVLSADEFRQKIAEGLIPESSDLGGSTDWFDELTQTPLSHTHNISIRSGGKNSSIVANLNVRQLEGIFKRSDNNVYTGRIEYGQDLFDGLIKTTFGLNSNNTKYTATHDPDINASFNHFSIGNTLRTNPTMPVRSAIEGRKWAQLDDFIPGSLVAFENPLAMIEERDGEVQRTSNRFYGSLTINPFEGLTLNGLGSIENLDIIKGYAESFQDINTTRLGVLRGFARRRSERGIDRNIDLTATYKKTLGIHALTALVGYNYFDVMREGFGAYNNNFPTDQFQWNNIGLGDAIVDDGINTVYSFKYTWNLVGYFGRLNYVLKDKYYAMASLRYEGSSKFLGSDEAWGLFYGFNAGWDISREAFLSDVDFVNNLKLRAGYGRTGSLPNDLYQASVRYGYGGSANSFLYNDKFIQTLNPTSNRYPGFTWEKKDEINIGLDYTLLDNRISGSIDVYDRTVSDLLFNIRVPVPPNIVGNQLANVGKMSNKGIELLLNVTPVRTKDVDYTASIMYSSNRNKLVEIKEAFVGEDEQYFFPDLRAIGEPILMPSHKVDIGGKIGNIWGFKAIGLTENGKWVYEDPAGGEPVTSSEIASSPNIEAEDYRQVIGNGLPAFYLNFNHSLRYKQFDLNVTMRGAFDYQIVNYTRIFNERPLAVNEVLRNRLASAYDAPFGGETLLDDDLTFNSYYVEDGDFWKIDQIELGYNIDLNKAVKSARIYVSTLNTFVFTKYSGIDPEVSVSNLGGLQPGLDFADKYPSTRIYSLGVNLTF